MELIGYLITVPDSSERNYPDWCKNNVERGIGIEPDQILHGAALERDLHRL